MKTPVLKHSLLVIIIVLSSLSANCQLERFVRGHFDYDIYVYTSIEEPYSGMYLLYLTMDGSKIAMQNNSNLYFSIELTAEPGPGMMVGHSPGAFGQSISYGKSFFALYPFVNYYTTIEGLYGGEIPGEYIIQGFDISLYPYPMGVIYKTSDYFANYTLIADTCDGGHNSEVGLVSGEFFQMPVLNKHAFLTHSLDFGVTSDTIPVDTTIINENTGLYFKALSRGSAQGELFLVTRQTVSATEIHYYIYHSTNYGSSWQLKSTKVFDSDRQQFTAGRGACKFYIANLLTTTGSAYYKLQLMFSSDCGETFTTYEHMLTPDVGTKAEMPSLKNKIQIFPNPAMDYAEISCNLTKASTLAVSVYNSLGKCVLQTLPEWQPTGDFVKTLDLKNLAPGFYSVQLTGNGTILSAGNLIISK